MNMSWFEVEIVSQKTVIIEADTLEEAEAEACNVAFTDGGEPSSCNEISSKEAMSNQYLVDMFVSAK
jgi:hypothetical protein